MSDDPPQEFLRKATGQASEYAGFNLLLGYGKELWYSSNRGPAAQRLEAGLYGLSNHLLDTPWPKVKCGKEALLGLMRQPRVDLDRAFAILADTSLAADADLPDTGIPLKWERALSAAFITSENYGTRCTTLLMRSAGNRHLFRERRFAASPGCWEESTFTWTAQDDYLTD